MARLILFFLFLFLAAVSDLKSRNIPDWIPCLIAVSGLLPPGQLHIAGLLVCLPLFIAGITAGNRRRGYQADSSMRRGAWV